MNSTSTQLLNSEFAKYIIDTSLKAIDDGKKEVARMCWEILLSFLAQHWMAVVVVLVIVLIISFIKALMGRWWTFGSVVYHYLYFGILFIAGLIWGPYIFVSILFDLSAAILYVFCYKATGWILNALKLHR